MPDACFNLIIDKGMFDSQLCSEENIPNVTAITKEMFRVLKPGGIYLVVSHGLPPTRLGYLNPTGINWSVEYRKVPKPAVENGQEVAGASDHHYMYVCKKIVGKA